MHGEEILSRIGTLYRFDTQERDGLAGPARAFRIEGAAGTFGIITPVTGHFCEECNRIRVTSSGRARSCLFADGSIDLKPYLACNDLPGLAAALRSVVTCKPRRHLLSADEPSYTPFAMSAVGG